MSNMSCNFCRLKEIKKDAKRRGNKVILRRSIFMSGTCVFEVPESMEELPRYIEPSNRFPKGNKMYQKYFKGWLMLIPKECAC